MTVSINRYWFQVEERERKILKRIEFVVFFCRVLTFAGRHTCNPCTCALQQTWGYLHFILYLIKWNTVFRLKCPSKSNKMMLMMHFHFTTNRMITALLRDQSHRTSHWPLSLFLNRLLYTHRLDNTHARTVRLTIFDQIKIAFTTQKKERRDNIDWIKSGQLLTQASVLLIAIIIDTTSNVLPTNINRYTFSEICAFFLALHSNQHIFIAIISNLMAIQF